VKKIIGLSLVTFLILPLSFSAAAEITADSRITQVMVYPDSVLVTREAQVKLIAGNNKVIFSDIIPQVDEDSLRVSLVQGSSAKILGAQLKQKFLEIVPSGDVQKLKDRILEVQDELKREQDVKNILSDEKKYLDSVRLFSAGQLPKDLVTKTPTPAELEGTLKFLDTNLKANFSANMDSELKSRELSNKLQALEMELSQISGPVQKLKRDIVVELDAPREQPCQVVIAYLVRGASWQPVYDARADFNKSEVELISYAIVRQNTGDDWQNVDLALSTVRPSAGGNMPYVAPWFLKPYQPPVYAERKMGLMMKATVASSVQRDAFKENEMMAVGGAANAPSVAYATPEEKGIAVVYTIPHKVSVKPDGADNKLPVSTQALKANFEYSSFPKAEARAFLGSRVTNAKELQLLAGRINVFLEGDFVGTSNIGNIGPQEDFDLYLGADDSVKVKRELLEKKVDETFIGNIPSATRKTNFKYKLTVENYKSRRIKVKLFEAIPVSQDDRIKIKINSVSIEPKEKDWKDRKGIWLWEPELDPRQKQEITYSFTVEHPREMQVDGL
jgi:uncharacterized protein (TIGR02231 family)